MVYDIDYEIKKLENIIEKLLKLQEDIKNIIIAKPLILNDFSLSLKVIEKDLMELVHYDSLIEEYSGKLEILIQAREILEEIPPGFLEKLL